MKGSIHIWYFGITFQTSQHQWLLDVEFEPKVHGNSNLTEKRHLESVVLQRVENLADFGRILTTCIIPTATKLPSWWSNEVVDDAKWVISRGRDAGSFQSKFNIHQHLMVVQQIDVKYRKRFDQYSPTFHDGLSKAPAIFCKTYRCKKIPGFDSILRIFWGK